MLEGRKEHASASAAGGLLIDLIDGVRLRPAPTIALPDGEVCEIYDPAWGLSDVPMVYAHQSLIRPGRTRL